MKVSKYGFFSGPYFPVFGPEKTPYLDTFHAVIISPNLAIFQGFYISYLKQKFSRTHIINYFFDVNLIHFFIARLEPAWSAIIAAQ